jgi:hypothetical protein
MGIILIIVPEVNTLIGRHPGEPSHILVDKGYLGAINSITLHLIRPNKQLPGRFLNQALLYENQLVLHENRGAAWGILRSDIPRRDVDAKNYCRTMTMLIVEGLIRERQPD